MTQEWLGLFAHDRWILLTELFSFGASGNCRTSSCSWACSCSGATCHAAVLGAESSHSAAEASCFLLEGLSELQRRSKSADMLPSFCFSSLGVYAASMH